MARKIFIYTPEELKKIYAGIKFPVKEGMPSKTDANEDMDTMEKSFSMAG